VGERGYAPPPSPRVTRIVNAATAPAPYPDWYVHGIRVRFCDTRLAIQPALAGLKHLNRLEQVLARAEWSDIDIAEGLMLDIEGRVVCATAANLFAVIDGQLLTPSLDRCGVAGVARAELLAREPRVRVCDLSVEETMRADELFLTSSVRGIVPVTRVGECRLPVGLVTRDWQSHWKDIVPLPEGWA
jgi:4-amino-4-deoxychorismate lyase